MVRKKRTDKEHIDRHSGRARHERVYKNRYQAARTALDRARRHYGRHIASEAHDKRYEAFSMDSHAVHDLVHDECRARHIARVFEKRQAEVEDEYIR